MQKNGRESHFVPGARTIGTGKGAGGANWDHVDSDAIRRAVSAASQAGGAIRFGLTRDGNAYAVGLYGDGDPYTVYVGPNDKIGEVLVEIAEFYYDLIVGNGHGAKGTK